ncbi:hypothetical protein QVD17_18883 [Tagetes erecta]|uniref:Uncharacterized protein n=1 Tax=Tagetes erecta TaxID=13708 RepID=A0AAD8KIX4_TARER|nr:hypothetical protein QVD17_18883 [Tagetes erecta]
MIFLYFFCHHIIICHKEICIQDLILCYKFVELRTGVTRSLTSRRAYKVTEQELLEVKHCYLCVIAMM